MPRCEGSRPTPAGAFCTGCGRAGIGAPARGARRRLQERMHVRLLLLLLLRAAGQKKKLGRAAPVIFARRPQGLPRDGRETMAYYIMHAY